MPEQIVIVPSRSYICRKIQPLLDSSERDGLNQGASEIHS